MTSQPARFCLRLTLFMVPVGLYLLCTVGVGLWAGEFTALRQVAMMQASVTPLLYGRAYRDNYFAYKLIASQVRKPTVLVLGSSRVMQLRSGFFNRAPREFYNGGGSIQKTEEITEFLSHLNETELPKILILGLDQPWFNSKTSSGFSRRRSLEQLDEEKKLTFARAMNSTRFVFKDILSSKIPFSALIVHTDPFSNTYAIGMNAIVRGWGFRNDGSYQYGDRALHPGSVAERLAEGFDHLAKDQDHLARGDTVDDTQISAVEAVLQLCRAHGIKVFAFSPPYAPAIVDKMRAEGRHQYLPLLSQRLTELFRKYDSVYIDAFDPRSVGATDDDMWDAYHASEFIMLSIYRQLFARDTSTLALYSDVEFLDQLISKHRNPFLVFAGDSATLQSSNRN